MFYKIFLFYEAIADGVVGQLGVGPHVHLVEDAATISADGLVAERQVQCNFFDSLPRSDRAQHFEFTIREAFMRYFGRL